MSNNLTSIIFPLTATTNTTLPVENGRIAQGALLHWLQRDKPELAVKLHDQYQRFYTVSGLQGEFEREKRQTGPVLDGPSWVPGKVVVTPDQNEWVRLGSSLLPLPIHSAQRGDLPKSVRHDPEKRDTRSPKLMG